MPHFPPIYVNDKTKARLSTLSEQTGFPMSHILTLAVTTLDEAYDDLDELIAVLKRQQPSIGTRKYERRKAGEQ